jgi:hypothetical protein
MAGLGEGALPRRTRFTVDAPGDNSDRIFNPEKLNLSDEALGVLGIGLCALFDSSLEDSGYRLDLTHGWLRDRDDESIIYDYDTAEVHSRKNARQLEVTIFFAGESGDENSAYQENYVIKVPRHEPLLTGTPKSGSGRRREERQKGGGISRQHVTRNMGNGSH